MSIFTGFDEQIIDWERLTEEVDMMLQKLFPICRSITGEGVRQTLSILRKTVDFDVKEIPSGTVCYDWVVPDEWNVRDAYVEDSTGNKIINFQENNLHLVSYSIPVDQTMSFQELEEHLHTLPALPNAIPYRTTYYKKDWGFCLSHEQFSRMDRNEQYHVRIDSTLFPGNLTYGKGIINGNSDQEFLISTYCCHPSMANDNLSGIVLWSLLFRELKSCKTRHTYRFVIIPETIGAIAYLAHNQEAMKTVKGGFTITTVAGPGIFGYKHTYTGNHLIDRVVLKAFNESGLEYVSYPFDLNGSDERQYSAPYFRIPMGTICKDKYQEYDYYHTSSDNLDFISAKDLIQTLSLYLSAIEKIELNLTYRSLNPYCEPMLSKRGLYPTIGGQIKQLATNLKNNHSDQNYEVADGMSIQGKDLDAICWIMFYSDGKTSLLDISEKIGLPLKKVNEVAKKLQKHNLLEIVDDTLKYNQTGQGKTDE